MPHRRASPLPRVQVFARMKQDDSERYLRLEHLANRAYLDARELYGGACAVVALCCVACRVPTRFGKAAWSPAVTTFGALNHPSHNKGSKDHWCVLPCALQACPVRSGARSWRMR